MYEIISQNLKERKEPINVAIVGSGWFGGGLARELYRLPGISPKVLIDKDLDKAGYVYLEMGINKNDIAVVKNTNELNRAQASGQFIIFSDLNLMKELENIDVVYEATGDMLGGTIAALNAIENGISFITGNFEVDAIIGLRLAKIASEKGVLYSGTDGDQPGCLARMVHEIKMWGFEPKILGNCKAFLDVHQNPTGVKPYVPSHQNPVMVCGMADGTKQSFEMASLGNAFGYYPLKRGMHGPTTTKQNLIKAFDDIVSLDSFREGYVDFVFGIDGVDQGAGVFIVAHRDGPHVQEDMKFLKKGEGPFYLFFRDHHLCQYEAFYTIFEIVLFKSPTFFSKGRYIDVISIAKQDLKSGQRLDGVGGYDCYGVVERADITAENKILPIGLAEYATLKENISQDIPITYDMVDLEDNLVTQLRQEQEQLYDINVDLNAIKI